MTDEGKNVLYNPKNTDIIPTTNSRADPTFKIVLNKSSPFSSIFQRFVIPNIKEIPYPFKDFFLNHEQKNR